MSLALRNPRPSDAALTLQTLGGAALFAATDTERQRPLLELGKPLALIAYVACAPRQEVAREHLHDLLWADLDPEAARHALRQTLWYLRRRLPEPVLAATRDVVTVATPLLVDRDELLEAIRSGDAERVVALYTGDFIPTYAAPGGALFEQWAEIERATLRTHFQRSAEGLVRQWLATGRFRDAQALARRLRDADPLRESAWRLLLESLLAGSDTVAALIEADNLEQLLSREEQEPEPATKSLLRLARHPAQSRPAPDGAETRLVAALVGREREFAQILEAWSATQAGRASHVHLTAPAGLGKTRLLHDVRARLRASRGRAVLIRATIGQRDVPYALASELAACLATLPGARGISPSSASALVAMNPTLSSQFDVAADHAQGAEAARRRTLALCELVEAVSHEHPVALLIDDTHWADDASRAILRGLVNCLDRTRALLVTAGRPTAEAEVRGTRTHGLALAPLAEGEVSALVESIAALPDATWAASLPARLTSATRGSPLLVLETLQLLVERGFLVQSDAGWRAPDPAALEALVSSGSALTRRVGSLEDSEASVLLLLSAAGTPLTPAVLSESSSHSQADLMGQLSELERRGLARRAGDSWMVAHDEIAAAVLEASNESRLRAAHGDLGRALWRVAGADHLALRYAARHLREAHDLDGLRQLFVRYVRLLRTAGDRRPDVALAADLTGGDGLLPPPTLVRALPRSWRLGLYSRKRIAVATAALLLMAATGTAALVSWGNQEPPDEEIFFLVPESDTTVRAVRVPIFEKGWLPGRPIDLRGRVASSSRLPIHPNELGVVLRPGTRTWSTRRTFADAGGQDIVELVTPDSIVRLTTSSGDDLAPTWSPDGRRAVFSTGRWNPLSHYDLAVLDRGSGEVTQLTSGDDFDAGAAWSPDGLTIGFVRRSSASDTSALCLMAADGTDLSCRTLPGHTAGAVLGWIGSKRIAVLSAMQERLVLIAVDAESDRIEEFEELTEQRAQLSADGRWLACACARLGYAEGTLFIVPVGRPHDAREVVLPATKTLPAVVWMPPAVANYVESLAIDRRLGNPFAGVPYRLSAHAITSRGARVALSSARWRIRDTSSASIDSVSGTLFPRDTGHVQVEVTSGGWRSASAVIEIEPLRIEPVAQLSWAPPLDRDWQPFGTPAPFALRNRVHEWVLAPNGDSSHSSGVLSRTEFDGSAGLALDVSVSTPITMNQWQSLTLTFHSRLSLDAVSPERLLVGEQAGIDAHEENCGFNYPGGREGTAWADSLGASAMKMTYRAPAPPSLRTGEWFQVRLQLLPDGRCGVAIDGRPVAITEKPLVRPNVRIGIGGYSHATRILVGPLLVRRGVPSGVDWATFEHSRKASAARRDP